MIDSWDEAQLEECLSRRRAGEPREAVQLLVEGLGPEARKAYEVAEIDIILKEEEAKSRAFEDKIADIEERLAIEREPAAAPIEPGDDCLEFRQLSSYDVEQVEWVWGTRIPKKMITVIEGDPGVGKSLLITDLVARISTGRPWPGEEGHATHTPETVLWLTTEDSPSHTILPRILAAGGEPRRVFIVTTIPSFASREGLNDEAEARLRATIKATGATWLILDPGSATVDDGNAEPVIRRSMGVFFRLGVEMSVTTLWIRHLAKAAPATRAQGNPLMHGIGSIGVSAAARSVIQVVKDLRRFNDNELHFRAVGQVKCNLTKEVRGVVFVGIVDTDKGPVCDWTGEHPELTLATIYQSNGKQAMKERKVKDQLREDLLEAFQRGASRVSAEGVLNVVRIHIPSAKGPGKWAGWSAFCQEFQVEKENGPKSAWLMKGVIDPLPDED